MRGSRAAWVHLARWLTHQMMDAKQIRFIVDQPLGHLPLPDASSAAVFKLHSPACMYGVRSRLYVRSIPTHLKKKNSGWETHRYLQTINNSRCRNKDDHLPTAVHSHSHGMGYQLRSVPPESRTPIVEPHPSPALLAPETPSSPSLPLSLLPPWFIPPPPPPDWQMTRAIRDSIPLSFFCLSPPCHTPPPHDTHTNLRRYQRWRAHGSGD